MKDPLVLALLLLLPIAVAAMDLSTLFAVFAVLVLLGLLWGRRLKSLAAPAPGPEMVLDSISASHFVEKVRWPMDRLGIAYAERPAVGTLGAFYLGRTVPRLNIRTDSVVSQIGNSREILQFLRGRYTHQMPERAAFMAPSAEADELEADLDRYGALLQQWIYARILPHREATLHVWGANDPALPAWQRTLLRVLYPVQAALIRRVFRIGPGARAKTMARVREALTPLEARLAAHPQGLLETGERSYVDYAFAGLSSIWLRTEQFANGRAAGVMATPDLVPPALDEDQTALLKAFPACSAFIRRLYQEERLPLPSAG